MSNRPDNKEEERSTEENIESPEEVVSGFYSCYLGCNQGNEYVKSKESPGDFCVKKCDGLSEVFKQRLLRPDEVRLADMIIWASDVPDIDNVTIVSAQVDSGEAVVFINFSPFWPDHRLKVYLESVSGQWEITNVKDVIR
ncbi:MAG: hypothetical protein PHU56_00805 [Candidatus Pacebacteria bacterium]|nr:hypothetical protein [Candidatus Paceibacterota bacterium]